MAFCSSCGTNIPLGGAFCNNCGQPVTAPSPAAISVAAAAQPARSAERKFFEDRNVCVTNTRFLRGNETFAMSGITSVKAFTEVPSKTGPLVVIGIGALVFLAMVSSSLGGALVGAVLIGLGILWLRSIKDIHHVRLVTTSGETDALSSLNAEYIGSVVGAINEAIVHRG